ncbi:glycosyltransferase [Mucor mucedo]|uniref:glycosyltransferase n=1 Tax=Mucor mucedo TaxID=29922 RepID=UPI00221FC7B6|nr:glycosyltransferase [Mucor mucedo]KAI7890139.1 glycosyltransferase [Mucor mucedo]
MMDVQKEESVRRRKSAKDHSPKKVRQDSAFDEDIDEIKKQLKYNSRDNQIELKHTVAASVVTIMSFFATFYMIWFPANVVFDEVHFGKFAGYYIQRIFFFDVHPPLAKLMLAAVGYMVGFDGVYQFSNIGESYAANHVPYICLRALPASLHVLGVALVYNIMRESGSSVLTCFLTATLYLLDNAFISQNRLILLDSILIFYMLTTIYAYIRFRKLRHTPFTSSWWIWLNATGVCMALTLSVKMVGVFMVAVIGIAVLMDLWDLLDVKHQLSNKTLAQHFGARCIGLIIVPSLIYLVWFYIHFAILTISGPGDMYMSAKFQSTLADSPSRLQSLDIMFNQSIKIQHRGTGAFLHSYNLNYPQQYEDGRFSSRGRQVVGNMNPDINSYWRLVAPGSEEVANQYIHHNDIVRLEHITTGGKLMTHNVAAPFTPTNQEFTTVYDEIYYNDTLFKVVLGDLSSGTNWNTVINSVNLVHVKTGVGLFCTSKQLPEWGQFHLEVNGNKVAMDVNNYWTATDILGLDAVAINLAKDKKQVQSMSFLSKFYEYQKQMIVQNSQLVGAHPYQSGPLSWPLMTRGVNYWTDMETRNQIYMTGNVAGWWGGLVCIGLFIMMIVSDQGLAKRGYPLMRTTTRIRLFRTGGFFLLLWAMHYLPFFLMGRSLFLHHYLPAMACNYLLIGSVFEYFFVDGVNSPVSFQPSKKRFSLDQTRLSWKSYLAATIILGMQFVVYLFLAPMTYGTPVMSYEDATRHKVLKSWDLQFTN